LATWLNRAGDAAQETRFLAVTQYTECKWAIRAGSNIGDGLVVDGGELGGNDDQKIGWHSAGSKCAGRPWGPSRRSRSARAVHHYRIFNINTGETSFTATGGLCPLGTFTDEVHAAGGNASRFNELFRTVYTCANGDTFFAQKHLHLVFNEDGSITSTGGPITLKGGTGAFTRLNGHGVDQGAVSADGIGVAQISGVLKLR
jgi:hypothetical protein